MQLDLPFLSGLVRPDVRPTIEFVRVRTARKYILRVRPDGTLRVTIPRRGSKTEALAFVARQRDWIAKERARVERDQAPVRWTHGSAILLDGEPAIIAVEHGPDGATASVGGRSVAVADVFNVRPEVERDLREIARARLIPRLRELADAHGLTLTRATIRNQRSRWGSCSRSGTIALNFRLVQMPPAVAEYVLVHELMHLKQQNHGPRFWALVEQACPDFRDAERWLRRFGRRLF